MAVGDLVYAKLLVASKDMEPELVLFSCSVLSLHCAVQVCVDSYGKKAGMGVLTGGGFMFTGIKLRLGRNLLSTVVSAFAPGAEAAGPRQRAAHHAGRQHAL